MPVDVEFGVEEGETVLNAAFRQGIALPHGCKEGQCSACKCVLVDGEVDLLKYSTFALNDMERESGHVLLCRSLPQSDIEVELLNYRRGAAGQGDRGQGASTARITRFEKLTHDIRGIEIEHRPADQVLGGPICRHHRHDRSRGDDYALVLHGKSAERNPKALASSSRNTPTASSPASSTTAASPSAPTSSSSDPTAPASGAKTETEP